jgi:hypothetical protein
VISGSGRSTTFDYSSLTGEHPLTGLTPEFGGVVPWHVWLLTGRAKLS